MDPISSNVGSAEIGYAIAAKQLGAEKLQGQEALSLIDSAAPIAQAPRGDGMTGAFINVAA